MSKPTFALRVTVGNLRLLGARRLANRSSLTGAGERRLAEAAGVELDTVFGKPRNYEFPRKSEATVSLKAIKNSFEPPNGPQLYSLVKRPEFAAAAAATLLELSGPWANSRFDAKRVSHSIMGMGSAISIKIAYRDGVFEPLDDVEGAKPGAIYTAFSDEELRDFLEALGWLKAAEKSFDYFWDNPADAVYDTL